MIRCIYLVLTFEKTEKREKEGVGERERDLPVEQIWSGDKQSEPFPLIRDYVKIRDLGRGRREDLLI